MCCLQFCQRVQSGANDDLMLYYQLWISVAYCCNASIFEFEWYDGIFHFDLFRKKSTGSDFN